jgi:hypothetical protein
VTEDATPVDIESMLWGLFENPLVLSLLRDISPPSTNGHSSNGHSSSANGLSPPAINEDENPESDNGTSN